MKEKIDVIVPMYNRAHCVEQLLDTLKKQTLQDFRVIFVDDGSTDDTAKVLPAALEKAGFPYMLITQENQGAGAARNTGLRASDAEWLVFVDSDDTLMPNYLEYLYSAMSGSQADFGFCEFQLVPDGQNFSLPEKKALDVEIISAAKCMEMHYTSWLSNATLMIRGSFQRENQIFYDEKCTYMEDNSLVTDLIGAATTVAKVNNVLYLYHIYEGSRSRSPSIGKYLNSLESFKRTAEKFKNAETDAASVFRSLAPARFYLATGRKAAVHMPYKVFLELCKSLPMKDYREQIRKMPIKLRVAGYLFLFSKALFYVVIRQLFRD